MAAKRFTLLTKVCTLPAMALVIAGCAAPVLNQARRDYYNNDPAAGIQKLDAATIPEKDRILFLMERGTLHQLKGDNKACTKDYNDADALLKKRDTLSITHGTASMVVNDSMLNFYGYPFERTYLHVMCALSYIAESDWQGAGVEARRIINSLKKDEIKNFPQDAFSRYLAGVCLELAGDPENAKVQYRKASRICKIADITEEGLIVPEGTVNPDDTDAKAIPVLKKGQHYITCFVLLGRVADYSRGFQTGQALPPVVSFSINGKLAGKALPLVDLRYLAAKSESIIALRKAAKTGTRVVGKAVVVNRLSKKNQWLGLIAYIFLFITEQDDFRHWETLPRYICAARFPCPADTETIEISVANGHTGKRPVTHTTGIVRNGLMLLDFERGF